MSRSSNQFQRYDGVRPTVGWRKPAPVDEDAFTQFGECVHCSELVKPGERFCSFFCRVEAQQE